MKNIALDTNPGFETIDLDALQHVSGGDAAQRWWDTLKQNATDTYSRYSRAATSYASSGQNLAKGNFKAAANDLGDGVINHAAGGLNLLNTVKDATDIIPRP